jgi:hypothetical protein
VIVSLVDSLHQRGDGLWLVAGGLESGDELKSRHVALL